MDIVIHVHSVTSIFIEISSYRCTFRARFIPVEKSRVILSQELRSRRGQWLGVGAAGEMRLDILPFL